MGGVAGTGGAAADVVLDGEEFVGAVVDEVEFGQAGGALGEDGILRDHAEFIYRSTVALVAT